MENEVKNIVCDGCGKNVTSFSIQWKNGEMATKRCHNCPSFPAPEPEPAMMYVTAYGAWGMERFEVFNVDNWQADDFNDLDAASDWDKLPLARAITTLRDLEAK